MAYQYVAENGSQFVVECEGRDKSGQRIIRFLIVERLMVRDVKEVERHLKSRMGFQRLPRALHENWYLPRWHQGVDVPFPHYSFPFYASSLHSDTDGFQPIKVPTYYSLLPFFFCLN